MRSADIAPQTPHIPLLSSGRLITRSSVMISLISLVTPRRSRTVTIPVTCPFSFVTGSLLTLCSIIFFAATDTGISSSTVIKGELITSSTWTDPGRRFFAITLQLKSCSVTIPFGIPFSVIMQLPTSSLHMRAAASAVVDPIEINVGFGLIISNSRISPRLTGISECILIRRISPPHCFFW